MRVSARVAGSHACILGTALDQIGQLRHFPGLHPVRNIMAPLEGLVKEGWIRYVRSLQLAHSTPPENTRCVNC